METKSVYKWRGNYVVAGSMDQAWEFLIHYNCDDRPEGMTYGDAVAEFARHKKSPEYWQYGTTTRKTYCMEEAGDDLKTREHLHRMEEDDFITIAYPPCVEVDFDTLPEEGSLCVTATAKAWAERLPVGEHWILD